MDEQRDWAYERVARFLAEHLGRDPKSIELDEPLTSFDIDSLEGVVFIMELEDELQVEIPYPEEPFRIVGDLVGFVRSIKT